MRCGAITPASATRPASWTKPRRVVAKVEWHPGELYPRVGFIVTNMTRPPERVTMFYNQRGTAEQRIKEGKNAVTWTRLSCRRFAANAVRLQLHALAYNLANFLRTLTLPEAVSHWSMTTLRDRLVKIGAKIVRHGRSITFQMAEVMVSRGAVPADTRRHRGVASIAAGAMLRGGAMTGRPDCQQERCVPMSAGRVALTPKRGANRGSQGFRASRGAVDLAGRPRRCYRSPKVHGWAGHMGNVGIEDVSA